MKATMKKVFGFRSGKIWKMMIAILYYFCAFAVLFFGLSTPLPIAACSYDQNLYYLSILVLFVWMMSPAIFLSNTPFREWLPLFRKHIRSSSVVGMMIVFLFFAYLFGSLESLHTPAYQQEFQSYIRAAYQYFITQGTR